MTLRDRITDIIGGTQLAEERRQNTEALDRVLRAGYAKMPLPKLVEELSEYNSSTVLQLVRAMQAGQTGLPYLLNAEDTRVYQMNESRLQWLYSPLAAWTVSTWTSYGLGESVSISLTDEDAQALIDKAMGDSAIFDDDEIHNLSDWVCVDGDLYLAAFVNIADGTVRFELMDTDEITEIVTNPDNKNEALYYKREYSDEDNSNMCAYYPDWHAYFYARDDLKAAKLPTDAQIMVTEKSEPLSEANKGTAVLILHIAHNRKDSKSLHGWPILGIAAPYLQAHKSFMEDRLTVSHQKASFVRTAKVTGGSRAVDAVKAKFQSGLSTSATTTGMTDSNPAQIAGSTLTYNGPVDINDLPMTTGAGDANTDNNMFAWMAGIGAGMFPTTLGLDAQRWATALAMDKTQAVQWSRYQTFWTSQFEKIVELILFCDEEWGSGTWDDKSCKVSIDTLSLVDFPGVVQPISQMLAAVSKGQADGTLPMQAAKQIFKSYIKPTLLALGEDNTADILSDELLGILSKEEREAAKAEEEKRKADLAKNPPPPPPAAPQEPVTPAEVAEYHRAHTDLAFRIWESRNRVPANH